MKQIQDVYIVAATRTPVGKAKGVFRNVRADDLLISALQGLLKKYPALDSALYDDVIIGCAMPEGEQGMNLARSCALLSGLPNTVPGVTINRFCASGLQAVALAADRIATGNAHAIIAGGVESMSRIPMGGFHFSANPKILAAENIGIAYGMGLTAELVSKKWGISREAQDNFALRSHMLALASQKHGYFAAEISPITLAVEVDSDEGPRKDTSLEALAKLKPAFNIRGTVTAGNSSQLSDGAAAILVASESFIYKHDLTPLARFCGYSVAGVAPEIMGVGPIAAIHKVLAQTNLKLEDMEWIELNEAFAAQALAVIQELQLDPEIINPQGGAIALGHPLGATGAIRLATLVHGLRRKKLRYGMVTMCVGTGMGAAGIFEAV